MVIDFLMKIFEDNSTWKNRMYHMYIEEREKEFNDLYKYKLDEIKEHEHELQKIQNKLNNYLEPVSYDDIIIHLVHILTGLYNSIKDVADNYYSMVNKFWIYENQKKTKELVLNIIRDINKIDNNFRKELFEDIEEILQNNLAYEDFKLKILILINRGLKDKRLDVRINHKSVLKDNYEIHEKLDKQLKPIVYALEERIDFLFKIIENCIRKDYREAIILTSILIAPFKNSLFVPFSELDKVLIKTILICLKHSLEGKDILNEPRILALLDNFLEAKQVYNLRNRHFI